jgi:hypothetical protein
MAIFWIGFLQAYIIYLGLKILLSSSSSDEDLPTNHLIKESPKLYHEASCVVPFFFFFFLQFALTNSDIFADAFCLKTLSA